MIIISVYRSTLNESDHKFVSTLCFKIKAKHKQTRSLHYQTTNLPSSYKANYQSVLAKTFDKSDQTSTLNSEWDTFKFSIQKACESLPSAPKISDPDWITNEVRNLSRKKQESWVCFKNAPSNDITRFKTEYNHLKELTKVTAEKARNSWWSDRAAEAEHWTFIAEQQGKGGSLIGDLCFLKKKLSKPASSALVAKDGITLRSDGDKLNCWAEHFEEVMNC